MRNLTLVEVSPRNGKAPRTIFLSILSHQFLADIFSIATLYANVGKNVALANIAPIMDLNGSIESVTGSKGSFSP